MEKVRAREEDGRKRLTRADADDARGSSDVVARRFVCRDARVAHDPRGEVETQHLHALDDVVVAAADVGRQGAAVIVEPRAWPFANITTLQRPRPQDAKRVRRQVQGLRRWVEERGGGG